MKRDKLTPYGDHRLQRIHPRLRKWTRINLYDRDRDWSEKSVGIAGLRENFSRDRGIEEAYWGPSILISRLSFGWKYTVSI